MEDFCCPHPIQPLRLPAAQSPTMAETLHPAFSGVQQYTGREASRPRPTHGPAPNEARLQGLAPRPVFFA